MTSDSRVSVDQKAADSLSDDSAGGHLLLGYDGRDLTTGVTALAAQLVSRVGASGTGRLTIVSAVEDPVLPPPELGVPIQLPVADALLLAGRERRLREQAREAGLADGTYEVEVREGDPALVLSAAANEAIRESGGALLLLGSSPHDVLDRIFGGETALRALRRSHAPVLIVPDGMTSPPDVIVVTTDFSEHSIAAGRKALELFPGVARIVVLHVAPPDSSQSDQFALWNSSFGKAVGPALARVRARLAEAAPGATIETALRKGRTAREIVRFAEDEGAGLVTIGSRNLGLLDRWVAGSVTNGVVRGARCAVLALPGVRELHDPGRYRPVFRDLSADEIEQLLASQRYGRIAFTFRDRVDIEPIHYVHENGWLFCRSGPGSKITTLRHNPWVAFEVDDVRGLFDWRSVVIKGTVYFQDTLQSRARTLAALRRLVPEAMTASDPTPDRSVVFGIHIDFIRGRAAEPAPG